MSANAVLNTHDPPASNAVDVPSGTTRSHTTSTRLKSTFHVLKIHVTRHMGPGIIAAVAYFDPGNWSVDLQAGSQYGYKLLFVVLVAGLGAIVLQVMACRLGCVTGLDLASHCRLLLYSRPKRTLLYRRLLYVQYALCEIAIICTDLAELLGSAIGLCLLIPSIPLYAGVLITSFDVIVVLAIVGGGGTGGRPVRLFEVLIIFLVLAVFASFIVLLIKFKPNWGDVFEGYLPSKTLLQPGALYTSIGILGATVMPHALFLGSSLATLDRLSPSLPPKLSKEDGEGEVGWMSMVAALFSVRRRSDGRGGTESVELGEKNATSSSSRPPRSQSQPQSQSLPQLTTLASSPSPLPSHATHKNNTTQFISSHLTHAIVDIVMSLLGFALVINSAILILAGSAYYYNTDPSERGVDAGLFEAHDLIRRTVGKPAAFVFALALLCSGQSASITATLAGQIVSEGFIQWSISPFLRRLLTRLIGLIPATVVAALVGRKGLNTLLVASQVALSIVLPFVVAPLVYFTSSKKIMRVGGVSGEGVRGTGERVGAGEEEDVEARGGERYENGKIMMVLGWLLFAVIVVANSYVLVELMRGKG